MALNPKHFITGFSWSNYPLSRELEFTWKNINPCQNFYLPVIDDNAVDAENVGDLPDQRLVGRLNTVVSKNKF